MNGFIFSIGMIVMLIILMLLNQKLLAAFGLRSSKIGRAILCFLIIGGAFIFHQGVQYFL